MKMTPWDRLNNELHRRKLGWQWVANGLDFDIQRVHNWKSRGVPTKHYRDIADLFNVSVDWIEGIEEQIKIAEKAYSPYARDMHDVAEPAAKYEINLQNNPAYPAVKRVKFKLSAGISGFGVEYDEGDNTPLVFNRTWYENNGYTPNNLFAVSVCNGSMEPGLHHNDVVIVNTESTTPKDGKVFAVNYEGEMVIKRLVRDAGQWWLSSDNADQRRYPRKACDENCQIIGEIVHKQSETI